MDLFIPTTKQKRVKCSNPNCSHVFVCNDKREPVVNDPGFLVRECPHCHCKTRYRVWNIDYYKSISGLVGAYEESEHDPVLSRVPLGESIEQEIDSKKKLQGESIPTFADSFWLLMGKESHHELKGDALKETEDWLDKAKQAYLADQIFMMGVDRIFIKVKGRKNAKYDYTLYAKNALSEYDFTTDNLFLIHEGKVTLPDRIDGLFTRNECFSILDFCLRRWSIACEQVIVAVPFIGFQYKNQRCKKQVLSYWAFLNSVLDMEKTTILTRKSEFNRLKTYLNEQKESETYDFKKYWGALDELQEAASKSADKKKKGDTIEQPEQKVYFTNKFHSKFYAGIYKDKVEVLVGSYNVHEGDVMENLSFKVYSKEVFLKKYIERILPKSNLIHSRISFSRILYLTVLGEDISYTIKDRHEVVSAIVE